MKVSNSFQQKLLKIHQSMRLWCDYLKPSTFFFFCWIPDGEKNILLYIETSVSPFYLHGMKYEMSQACNPLNSQDLSTNVSLL